MNRGAGTKLAVLLLAILLNNVIWAIALPYNAGPDELDHFGLARFIHDNQRIPILDKDLSFYLMDSDLKQPVPKFHDPATGRTLTYYDLTHGFELRGVYSIMPPLPYILSAMGMGIIPADHPKGPLLGARLLMILSGVGLALMTWLASCYIWPGRDELALTAAAVAGFLPMISFLSGCVNADIFAAFAVAFALAVAARGQRDGWTRRDALGLGLALGVVAMSRQNAYSVIPLTLLLPLAAKADVRTKIGRLLMAGLPGLLLGFIWYGHNKLLYGDPMGLAYERELRRQFVGSLPPEVLQNTYMMILSPLAERGYGLGVLWESGWFGLTLRSLFGEFGWREVMLPEPLYLAALALALAALAGWIRQLFAPSAQEKGWGGNRLLGIVMLLSAAGCLALSIYRSLNYDWQPQGRYLAPALLPLALFVARGVQSVFSGETAQRICLRILFYFMLLSNLYSLYAVVLPYYMAGTSYAP